MNSVKNDTKNDIIINKPQTNQIIPLSVWIQSILSFRFISNFTIIVSIIAYYMNAYEILFIVSPLMIVNFILITYILFTNLDTFIKKIFEKYLPEKNDRDNYKTQFVILITLWHLLPIFWLFYILEKDNLVKYFRPNFMGMYLKSIIIPILYYYYENNEQLYGNINYLIYFIFYIILLLGVCIYLYLE